MKLHHHNRNQTDAERLAAPRDLMIPFIRMLVPSSNLKESKALVKDKADAEWLRVFGAELTRLELEVQEREAQCARETALMTALKTREGHTHPYVKFAAPRGKADHADTPFSQWTLKDQITFVFCVIALILVAGAGMMNIFTNMTASHPVFLEYPWMAALFCPLLPISFSVSKFLAEQIETDRYRRLYIRSIFSLTLLVALIWAALFSQVYEGPAAGLNLDRLGEEDPMPSWLTGCQLLLEGLVGSSLSLMLGQLQLRYSPGHYGRSPESLMVNEIIDGRRPKYDASHTARNDTRARLVELEASRRAFGDDMLALFLSLRQRFEEAFPINHVSRR